MVAHTTLGGAKVHRRSKDKDDSPIGGDYRRTMRKPKANVDFLKALWKAYDKPVPVEPDHNAPQSPTGGQS